MKPSEKEKAMKEYCKKLSNKELLTEYGRYSRAEIGKYTTEGEVITEEILKRMEAKS